jgi:hypothetical protein
VQQIREDSAATLAAQLAGAARVLELAQRLGLDLPDALAGDRELLAPSCAGIVGWNEES